ncbi:MAG: hypothetical protein FWC43_13275 [Planctomycetaceae bacterium]|nr:hypothetical protein [Planctomycetaceae bacterium]
MIIFDAGTQARVKTDIKTCQAYIESMKDGVEFPPLDVFSDGSSEKVILADGFHRLQSHCSFRPNEPIRCRVHLGTVADARIFAAGANISHGLRRTNEDKRKAVKMILQEQQCDDWSDRRIAEHVKVGKTLVFTLRRASKSGGLKDHLKKRIGQDGKSYPATNKSYAHPDEPPEPETNFRVNADGKTVNICGFDFTARRRCDECAKWNSETGICARDYSKQSSWTPGCCDWLKLGDDFEEDRQPDVERLQTHCAAETTRKNRTKTHHVKEKTVKCKLYPNNPELSAVEIRHVFGNEFLLSLQKSIETILNEE